MIIKGTKELRLARYDGERCLHIDPITGKQCNNYATIAVSGTELEDITQLCPIHQPKSERTLTHTIPLAQSNPTAIGLPTVDQFNPRLEKTAEELSDNEKEQAALAKALALAQFTYVQLQLKNRRTKLTKKH